MAKRPTGKLPPGGTDSARRSTRTIKNILDQNSISDFEVTLNSAFERIGVNMVRAADTARHAGMDDDDIEKRAEAVNEELDAFKKTAGDLVAALRRGARD